MGRLLADLLGMSESTLTGTLQNLEDASGRPGVDVRLIAELSATVHQKTRELGLDPRDTTAKELYHALQALVGLHDTYLAQVMGANDPQNVTDVLPRIVDCATRLPIPKNCWALKHSVAKRLLKKMPPKKIMKQLHYRSVDSLLKRENMAEIVCASRFAESKQWQAKFVKSYKQLSPSDFESRDIEIITLDADRWGSSAQDYVFGQHHNLTHLKELGVILVLPLPVERMPGLSLTLLPMILHNISEIRLYSAFFKLQQVKPHFGEILAKTILDDPVETAVVAGQPVHWRAISHHFGRQARKKGRQHPEVFEPHVQPDDLYYKKAEEVIYRLEPALKFWENLDYVATMQDGRPISFNLLDNAINYCNGLEYGQQTSCHVQQSLWNELLVRYMDQESLEQQVLGQLTDELVESELLGVR